MTEEQTAEAASKGAIRKEGAGAHEVRSFATLITMIEDGRLHHELCGELRELIEALRHAGSVGTKVKGRLNLALNFTFDGETMTVAGEMKSAKPKAPRGSSVFWTTEDNVLSTRHPRQMDLPIYDATPGARGPTRIA